MTALSLSPAGDWDSKLDDMLADLETGTSMKIYFVYQDVQCKNDPSLFFHTTLY